MPLRLSANLVGSGLEISMEVRVKLMGVFRKKEPPGNRLNVPDGASVMDLLSILDIPSDAIHIVMINGQQSRDLARRLADDDEVTVLAPVGGG